VSLNWLCPSTFASSNIFARRFRYTETAASIVEWPDQKKYFGFLDLTNESASTTNCDLQMQINTVNATGLGPEASRSRSDGQE